MELWREITKKYTFREAWYHKNDTIVLFHNPFLPPSPAAPCIYRKGKPIRGKFDCALPHGTLQFNGGTPTGTRTKPTSQAKLFSCVCTPLHFQPSPIMSWFHSGMRLHFSMTFMLIIVFLSDVSTHNLWSKGAAYWCTPRLFYTIENQRSNTMNGHTRKIQWKH